MGVELHRANVGLGRKTENGVQLVSTPELYCAVITSRGKEGRLQGIIGHRPHPPTMLLEDGEIEQLGREQ